MEQDVASSATSGYLTQTYPWPALLAGGQKDHTGGERAANGEGARGMGPYQVPTFLEEALGLEEVNPQERRRHLEEGPIHI